MSRELLSLAKGPNRAAKRLSGYVVNGYRFHTKRRDEKCTTQNSGVHLTAWTTSFASAKDENPTVGEVGYYGSIEEIIELDYWGAFSVVLFRCTWYIDDKDGFGFTRVNFNRVSHKNDPYVMSTQAQQVFYIQDPIEKQFRYPIKRPSSEFYDTADQNDDIKFDINGQLIQHSSLMRDDEVSWFRDDVPTKQIIIPSKPLKEKDCEL